ncbi:unnamed protein product [marine sediment metagenome]|uniref:Uncharacterized protein n=1 Tax=marine sediment metagenome TaxID=412755 RepID=X0XLK9_9ZZZZ
MIVARDRKALESIIKRNGFVEVIDELKFHAYGKIGKGDHWRAWYDALEATQLGIRIVKNAEKLAQEKDADARGPVRKRLTPPGFC